MLFLIGTMVVTKLPPPSLATPTFWPWIVLGALSQIIATALMLSVMNRRSFVAASTYIKTEPVQVAIFGLVFLHDQAPGVGRSRLAHLPVLPANEIFHSGKRARLNCRTCIHSTSRAGGPATFRQG